MSDAYIGEIRNFAFNFAPAGWLQCQGQLLSIAQNEDLFSLLGTTYGGNGVANFALPDLRGRAPIGIGQGAFPMITQGQTGGQNTVTLTVAELPAHTHAAALSGLAVTPPTVAVTVQASSVTGTTTTPTGNYIAGSINTSSTVVPALHPLFAPASPAPAGLGAIAGVSATLSGGGITGGTVVNAVTGNGTAVATQPPFLGSNYCICVLGLFPSRS